MARRKPKAGRWELVVPGWRPPSLNSVRGRHFSAEHRAKKAAAEALGVAKALARCPDAEGRRRVRVVVTLGPRMRPHDGDNPLKILWDALTRAHLIVDDSAKHLEWLGLTYSPTRAARPETLLVIEEVDGG
jgi:Holliday junction resolvase RusA-like endonuclease